MNSSESRGALLADDTPGIHEDLRKIDLNADVISVQTDRDPV
jgi:hypothetical protein